MNDSTKPTFSNAESAVMYRCSCGAEVSLLPSVGGCCTRCRKSVTPKALRHDLALTMTIQAGDDPSDDQDFALARTQPDNLRAEDPEFLIGKTFGHFEIVDSLGSGGMGQVYRALDKSLQRYVAVKVLRSGIGSAHLTQSSDAEIDALLQEAVSQARVTHPNIVTIYYVGKQDGDPFLAMELVNGRPLSHLIDSKTLTFSHISPIALQLARALQFSYQLDIIHGDIKPSNILVQANGLTKLSDFGMARRASDDTQKGLGGTPNYIAPELLKGSKPTIQSDMYALGVTLFEMTFGRLPVVLTGSTIGEWKDCHENRKIEYPSPWPENFPEGWKGFLMRLLAMEPSGRFESYEELIGELNNLKPESRILARRAPRLIAACVDWITVLLFMAPVQMVSEMNMFEEFFRQHPIVEVFFKFSNCIPIALYTLAIFVLRQSIGRSLMHIRVVNEYGLIPPRNTMVFRSFLRMCIPWIICLTVLIDSDSPKNTILLLSTIFVLLNVAFLIIYDKARSLHDLIFRTRVVLDTD